MLASARFISGSPRFAGLADIPSFHPTHTLICFLDDGKTIFWTCANRFLDMS